MFGPWMIPLLGAAAGGMLDKKRPLRGMMLGGAAGAAPGLLGMGATSAATNPALIESAVGTTGYGASSATPTGLLGSFNKYAQPVGSALTIANQTQGLLGQQQAPQAAQLAPTGDPIGQMLGAQQQQEMLRKQIMEKLQRRMYGGTL